MTLEEQIKWEEECLKRGSDRYKYTQDRLKKANQGDRSDVGSYILKQRLEEVAEYLKLSVSNNTGVGGKYNPTFRQAANEDYLKIAYLGIQIVIQNLIRNDKKTTQTNMIVTIGSRMEADTKCRLFEHEHEGYYNEVIKSFKSQKVMDYTHKHKVLMKKFNEFDIKWKPWSTTIKGHLGSKVLNAILHVFDDLMELREFFISGKTQKIIALKDSFTDWITAFEEAKGILEPALLPLKIEPRDWTLYEKGGYYTVDMINSMEFVKVRGKAARDYVKDNEPYQHKEAVNRIQKTPWRVNKRILDIQSAVYNNGLGIGIPQAKPLEIPAFPEHLDKDKELYTEKEKNEVRDWKVLAKAVYRKEQERKGQVLAFIQSFKLANELEDWEEFYYAYYCDFRGRIYCATSGLSPQGADTARGLLEFANGVELGEDGVRWLAINIANKYGNDKGTYDERVAWVHSNKEEIRKTVENPLSYTDFWAGADKPYQFLACLFEWADCDYGKDTTYISRQPIGLDGSCNGLQHFSAMLRDSVGAKATNLISTEMPEDIYQQVADVCTLKLQSIDHPWARKWLQVGLNRKLAKRPVMTLPYGSTKQSARNYILDYTRDHWGHFDLDEKHQVELASWLTPHLWDSISEVVVAARVAMNWLQSNAKDYMKWLSPVGFPVYQHYKEVKRYRIRTQLCGEVEITLKDYDNQGKPHKQQQRNGIAPNFVHSVDSSHMVMTILATEFKSYCMVHDDFATHAGNTQILFDTIRETFHDLYNNIDPLADFAEQNGLEYDLEKGDYNIDSIFDADYFFG